MMGVHTSIHSTFTASSRSTHRLAERGERAPEILPEPGYVERRFCTRSGPCAPDRSDPSRSRQSGMKKKVATAAPGHQNPFSDSTPGGQRVAPSRAGRDTRVGPTITSPKPTPHPWPQARAAGPAGTLRKLARHRLGRRLNRNHVGGDRSGPLGVRRRLISPMQN